MNRAWGSSAVLSGLLLSMLAGCPADDAVVDGGVDAGEDARVSDGGWMQDGARDVGTGDTRPPPWDGGPPIGDCVPENLADDMVRVCIPFPSGVREFVVPLVDHSFGDRPPPDTANFDSGYEPGPGECSQATHDRYWVRGRDGQIYRTWHPPSAVDVETGEPCHFGHEHGDDPRTSVLYQWAGGVPFGIVNRLAQVDGHHRHEDHFGHKVVVQNDWQAVIGNPPDGEAITGTGFRCHWLSKVHQGTHSGDALGHNEHEYQNNTMCDDGAMRMPDPGRDVNTGPTHHTASSIRTLTTWGPPGAFKACDSLELMSYPGDGREPDEDADTNREIKCADFPNGWVWQERPRPITSESGHLDYEGKGIDELWKPWATIYNREGSRIFLSSAYYVVRDPIRVYNPEGGPIPRRDVDGDREVDAWIPTLEMCFAHPEVRICENLPEFPTDVPQTEWWRLPQSPFRGVVRVIHPKRIDVANRSDRSWFCTDYRGVETSADPTFTDRGVPMCPEGQLPQYVANTQNLWWGDATWGPAGGRGGIDGSDVNARNGGTVGAGYGHEWVRFFDADGIHAPN